jgi:hypothetical protein
MIWPIILLAEDASGSNSAKWIESVLIFSFLMAAFAKKESKTLKLDLSRLDIIVMSSAIIIANIAMENIIFMVLF